MTFRGFSSFSLVHFYTNSHPDKIERWWTKNMGDTFMLLGEEKENYQRRVMNPLLLQKVSRKQWNWNYDRKDESTYDKDKVYSEPDIPPSLSTNSLEKKVFLEMLKGYSNKVEIARRVQADNNKVYATMNKFLENGAVLHNYEMPLFSSLDRNLLVFRYSEEDYTKFIEEYLVRIPYGKSTVISDILTGEKFVLAILGLPPLYSRNPIRIILDTFEESRIIRLHSHATSNIISKMQLRGDSWNSLKLPQLKFSKNAIRKFI